jgi:hypothetical protein
VGLVGLAEDRVVVDLGHVGPGQAKYLGTARVAPGVGRGHSGTGPSPCGSTVALLRESAPWSRGELGVPLRVTWWVPSESGAARGGRGRAELAGHVAGECQSMSESGRYAAIQMSVPRAWECHAGSRGWRLPARRPGLGSPLGSGWWSLKVTAAMLQAGAGAPAGGPPG